MAERKMWTRFGVALALAASLGLSLGACGATRAVVDEPQMAPETTDDGEVPMNQNVDAPEASQPSTTVPTAPTEGETVSGEVLLTVAPDAEAPEVGDEVGGTSVTAVEAIGSDPNGGTIYQLTLADDTKTDDAIAALDEVPGYTAQPNHVYHLM